MRLERALIPFLLLIFAGCVVQNEQPVQEHQPDAATPDPLSEAYRTASEAKEAYEQEDYGTAATKYKAAALKYREGGAYTQASTSSAYAEQALEADREKKAEEEWRARNAAREEARLMVEAGASAFEAGHYAFKKGHYKTAQRHLEKAAQKYKTAEQKYKSAGDYSTATELEEPIARIDKAIRQAKTRQSAQDSQTFAESAEKLSEDYEIGQFPREYRWEHLGKTYRKTFNLYPKYYEFFKRRGRIRDYDLFASDYYSADFTGAITDALHDYAVQEGLSEAEIPYFIVSFIQHLPYTSDDVTTGFDEYPRFPYETIYDNGGDCEDTSILAAAMLKDLGYGVVLLGFQEHMAVGVKCKPHAGESYYEHRGTEYCYLETTGENWDIGSIPPEYENEKAKIYTIFERPALEIDFSYSYSYNAFDVYVDVDVNVTNLGSANAEDVKIYVALQTSDENKVWDDTKSEELEIEPEEGYTYSVTNLRSPAGRTFRVYARAFGDNVISDEATGDWIYWK